MGHIRRSPCMCGKHPLFVFLSCQTALHLCPATLLLFPVHLALPRWSRTSSCWPPEFGAKAGSDIVHPLSEVLWRGDRSRNPPRRHIVIRVILHLVDCIIFLLSLAKDPYIGQQNIAILDLCLTAFLVHRDTIALLDKVAFSEHPANDA